MKPAAPPTSDGRSTTVSGRHGGRGPGRVGRSGRRNLVPTIPRQRFEGATEELKGQIFDLVGARSADLFIKSKKRQSPTTLDELTNTQGIYDALLKPSPCQRSRYQQPPWRILCRLSSLQFSVNRSRNTLSRRVVCRRISNFYGPWSGANVPTLFGHDYRPWTRMRRCTAQAMGWNSWLPSRT